MVRSKLTARPIVEGQLGVGLDVFRREKSDSRHRRIHVSFAEHFKAKNHSSEARYGQQAYCQY